MKIEDGNFYFVKDSFFEKFNNYDLMQNKENGNKRPCYFCFRDKRNKKIIWFVPITSKVEKYKTIYNRKKKKLKNVYNFVFGNVLGNEKVFLIQNIFPVTEIYVESRYMNKSSEVKISRRLEKEVIEKAMKVILLYEKGIKIPFYDIKDMKEKLLKEDN